MERRSVGVVRMIPNHQNANTPTFHCLALVPVAQLDRASAFGAASRDAKNRRRPAVEDVAGPILQQLLPQPQARSPSRRRRCRRWQRRRWSRPCSRCYHTFDFDATTDGIGDGGGEIRRVVAAEPPPADDHGVAVAGHSRPLRSARPRAATSSTTDGDFCGAAVKIELTPRRLWATC